MSEIKLDPRKLLGLRIIATGDSAMALHSPKIGGKGCPVIAGVPEATGARASAALTAKIGSKLPPG